MAYNYDKLYGDTPNALGDPTQIFVDFFSKLSGAPQRVLDIGCGQGRDALFIARLGHHVVGVDLSANGIRDLRAAAEAENLPITGHVADITKYTPDGNFEIILIDRTLHMLDQAAQQQVLATLLDHVTPQGWVLIADETSNIAGFQQTIAAHHCAWSTQYAKRGYLFLQRH
ncbi:class I SAM-dependent methyltransferase [Cognatishimia sp. SS12]|uniref:class I SAM-dependent methyltransferase n=1 Tax=Cognatishimia sp. SS12 TaxID=2979465 RepID=UPI00232E307F|nr:class I SAM-dependent methyltransferase [Cognatishimia sp. SS12]MDC0736947.1 class I SAM-dependent methyltransferase [Cognatishimia sp. SS12]